MRCLNPRIDPHDRIQFDSVRRQPGIGPMFVDIAHKCLKGRIIIVMHREMLAMLASDQQYDTHALPALWRATREKLFETGSLNECFERLG